MAMRLTITICDGAITITIQSKDSHRDYVIRWRKGR